jgi:4-amino-4-deoxy-L-arabinose transferase-like glycosyltransferase
VSGTATESREPSWWKWVVVGVLAGALALRLTSAACTRSFIKDEADLVRIARGQTLTGAEGAAGRPTPTSNHPPLAVLLIRIPLALGADAPRNVRLPFVVLSVLGLALAYVLARRGFGRWPALIALVLLAVDQFHLVRSRTASEAMALAFVPVILYLFYRAVSEDRGGALIVAGLLVGVGYLAKEDTLLLVPAMGLFLLSRRSRRRWFRRGELYLALFAVAALVCVDVYFNATGAARNLSRISQRTAGIGLTLRATSLYLGELFIRMVERPAEFVWIQDRWSWEVPAMNWVAGLVCLAAAIYATGRQARPDPTTSATQEGGPFRPLPRLQGLRDANRCYRYRDELTSLLLWVFWVVFAAASVVSPTHGFFELDLKKWAGASLIPAAILAGDLIYRRTRQWRLGRVLAGVLLVYLIGNGIRTSLVRNNVYSLPARAAQPPR